MMYSNVTASTTGWARNCHGGVERKRRKGVGSPQRRFLPQVKVEAKRERDLGQKMFDLLGLAIMSPEGAFRRMLSGS